MRTNLQVLIFMSVLCSGMCAHAQDYSEQPVPKEAYGSSTKAPELRNRQKVQRAFQSLASVATLDFSRAVPNSVSAELTAVTEKTVRSAGYLNYSNAAAINSLLAQAPEVLSVKLSFKGETLTADLVKANLFGEGFKVSLSDPPGPAPVETGIHYQGTIRGKNAMVTFSFFRNEFSALIFTDEATNNVIEVGFLRTAANTDGTHIIYTDTDLKVDFSHPCKTESLEQYKAAKKQLAGRHSQETEKSSLKCVTYWWETTYDMYTTRGSSYQQVSNYMTFLFNNFQIVFNNENIGSLLNHLEIWTTEDGLYDSIPGDNLETFSDNRTGFDADLATLFSTVVEGGVAHPDVLCIEDDSLRHSYCGNMGLAVDTFPHYSWPVLVTAHEVGHNLGSQHTHDCVWGPDNNTAIDGCGSSIFSSCPAPYPSNGGTIMSYCHDVSSIGINFLNGFGPLPGDRIRDRVNSCITRTCESDDEEPCADAFEPNESQDEAVTIAVGTAYAAGLSSEADNDWYRVETASTASNTYSLVGPDGAEYDMMIYDSNGTLIGSGTTTNSATETVTISSQPPGTYFIHIYGYAFAENTSCYTIKVAPVASSSCQAYLTAFEPNGTQEDAATIDLGTTYTAAIFSQWDDDWYRVDTYSTSSNTFSLAGSDGANLDMRIYNFVGTEIGAGTSDSAIETVTLYTSPGTYFIHIYGNGASCYTITVNSSDVVPLCQTAFEPNDSLAQATTIAVGTTYTAGLSPESDNSDDWYRVETSLTSDNTYTLIGPNGANPDMLIYNTQGTVIGMGTSSSATETVTLDNQAPGTYFILIYGSTTSCYTLAVTSEAVPACETAFEPNESGTEAVAIAVGTTYTAGLSSEWDNDWYRVETSSTANNTFSLIGPDGADYEMLIYNGDGTWLDWISGTTAGSATGILTLYNQPPGTYYIQIYGNSFDESTSCYTIAVASAQLVSCEAAFEPNESQAEAATIAVGTTNTAWLSYSSPDNDFYRVETSSTTNNTFSLVGPDGANLDMIIYNSDGAQIGWGISGSATETVTLYNQSPGTYFIQVYGYYDYYGPYSTSCYTITATSSVFVSCEAAFEPNNSLAEAAPIAVGTTYTAGLSPGADEDYYRVETFFTSNNTYNLVGPDGAEYDMAIYSSDGTLIDLFSGATAGSATETITIDNQPPGTYFIQIYGYGFANNTSCYTITVVPSEGAPCETAFEPNESQDEAAMIALGTTNTAWLSYSLPDNDWYRVETFSTTNNTFNLVGPDGANLDMAIYNSDGALISWGFTGANNATETVTLNNQPPGTYFIQIYGYYDYYGPYSTSCYTITATSSVFVSCETDLEPNESLEEAVPIALGTTYIAGLYPAWENDFYRVETYSTANNTYSLVGPPYGADYDMLIYDSNGTWISSASGTTAGSATETITIDNQPPGTYFIQIYGYYDYYGPYSACYTITVVPSEVVPSCETAFEPNNSRAEAATIAVGMTNTARLSPDEQDWYRVETYSTASNTYSFVAPAGADYDMVIHSSNGTPIGWGGWNSASETVNVTLNNQPPGTYIIVIYSYYDYYDNMCYTFGVTSTATAMGMMASTNEEEKEQTISVYPNPTHDMIYLSQRVAGKLTDQLGKMVKTFNGSEVSLKELQPGVYLLQVEGSPDLHKIVKE